MPGPTTHTNPHSAAAVPPGAVLPLPDAAQQAQSQRVVAAVHAAVANAGGWLPFDEYLALVMYGPGLGYYSAGSVKFGAAGDFVTAPELSSLFGHCVARQIAPVLQILGGARAPGGSGAVGGSANQGTGGAPTTVLEFGAGSGRLAFDVLTRLDTLGQLPAQYLILEISGDLRARQQALLGTLRADLAARVQWLDALPASPIRGVILANEVLDALPFKRFAVTADSAMEQGVASAANGSLAWQLRPAAPALLQEVARMQVELGAAAPAAGFQSECCLLLDGWIASLGATLGAGAILLFDYGVGRRDYYHAERSNGTLRCHYRHRAHDDPFLWPGLQDITAWVDCTRVAEAADAAGLDVSGYCTQAAFLMGAGIDRELQTGAEATATTDRVAIARRASEARQLLLPGEMGETFKAIALTRHLDLPLAGFALQDLRRHL